MRGGEKKPTQERHMLGFLSTKNHTILACYFSVFASIKEDINLKKITSHISEPIAAAQTQEIMNGLHTILGHGPPHDFSEFWRSVEAACHSWQGMCLTTALQWHRIRTIAVQGGQGPGWHACRQLWLHPCGRGLSHADSHGWQFSPAWVGTRGRVRS